MPNDQPTEEFDWVAAQARCTSESMFARLQGGAKKDVERRNGLSGRADGWSFEFHQEDVDRFEVSRVLGSAFSAPETLAFVTFEREGRRINVHGDGVDVEFTARPSSFRSPVGRS